MVEGEAYAAAKVLVELPPEVSFSEVAGRLRSLQTWLHHPKLVTRILGRVASTQPSTAHHVLNFMQSQQIKTNAFHYTAVIAGCARKVPSEWEVAIRLLQQMVTCEIQQDTLTFNSAINACGKSVQWEASLFLVDSMAHVDLEVGTDSMNSVIGACTRGAQWERALWMANSVPQKDGITFGSALAACDKGSAWRSALDLLRSMVSASVSVDNFGYSAAISACATAECWAFACHLLEMMVTDAVLLDLVSYGAVVKALDAGKEWAMALWLLKHIFENHQLNEVLCNSTMSACSSGSQWQHACFLLASMPDLQVSPEDVSYNTAITACVRASTWQQGLIVFQKMPEAFLEPDHFSFNSALSACQKGSQWQLGLTLLEKMSLADLQPNEFCFTSALSACEVGGWQVCLQVLRGLQASNVQVMPGMFGVLMSACETNCAWEAALATLQEITSCQLIPDALHVGSAANALRKGKGHRGDENAFELLQHMKYVWINAWPSHQTKGLPQSHAILEQWHAQDKTAKIQRLGQGVVACLKPAGIATEVFVEELAAEVFPDSAGAFSIVSRLDHPTSGILMLAIGCQGSPSANWLQVQFASRLVDKKYICLCEGLPLGNVGATGSVSVPLYADEARGCTVADRKLGRESLTKYKILARYVASSSKELMLLEVKPVTGRTHQIRVHMAYLGRPLVGDLTYGPKETSILPCERLFLHCRRVCLRDFSDQKFCAVAALPSELREVLAQLELL